MEKKIVSDLTFNQIEKAFKESPANEPIKKVKTPEFYNLTPEEMEFASIILVDILGGIAIGVSKERVLEVLSKMAQTVREQI